MSGLLSLHFYVLAQYTAMAVVGVSTLRFITSIITRHVFFMYLFLVITLCVGYVTYEAWYNLLAILAGLLGVIATFQPTDKRLREIMFSSSGTMAMHDFIVGTPVGLSVDLVALVSNSIGYYRYYIQKDST
jgi:hypothetical protein